jgi:hypothetical protein
VETRHPKRPEIIVLKGEEALEVLTRYVEELREGQAKELTEKQIETMTKLANSLISTIKSEAASHKSTLKNSQRIHKRSALDKEPPSLASPPPPDSPLFRHLPLQINPQIM